jgi:cysteine-rich repeat protein
MQRLIPLRQLGALGMVLSLACGEQVLVRETKATCGNSTIEIGEACDDGNQVNTDACTIGCTVASCGDGTTRTDLTTIDEGFEACDDGNEDRTDACTNRCKVASCGDAVLRSDVSEGGLGFEACDDGNQIDTDACRNACTEARCGDGVVRSDLSQGEHGFEACDDGNTIDTDGCLAGCVAARCGDGVVYAQREQCDDGNAVDDDACSNVCVANLLPTRITAGLPRIHDYSDAPAAHVDGLIRRALDGLGLDAQTGPSEGDRLFVGRWYMAWIDETGFYGKINGLWALNGNTEALGFVLLDGDRPVNALVVGERGQGRWPGGYKGAEHIEYPNAVPEADDDPSCAAENSFCAQYSLAEAPHYTDPDIPSWSACNEGSPAWDEHFEPIEVTATANTLRLVYEGRLTKQGDFGGSSDGNNCHADFLFNDDVRRPVYLRLGYELDATNHDLDRIFQVRNPDGNPALDGPFSFIGGFVMTEWPAAHPLKRLNRWVRVTERQVGVNWSGRRINFEPGEWTRLPDDVPQHDVVLGWAGQPVSLSNFDAYADGRSFTVGNYGPEDNDDSGFCLCFAHGGIEMGGGLIHDEVAGGTQSMEARRRLTIHHQARQPIAFEWLYEAERDLHHAVGRAEADGWSAWVGPHEAGHLIYGPYAQDWSEGELSASFRLMVDVVRIQPEIVATLDIFDADTAEIVATQEVLRSQFNTPFVYQDFVIRFNNIGRLGHRMETRVFWHDISYMRVDRVLVERR